MESTATPAAVRIAPLKQAVMLHIGFAGGYSAELAQYLTKSLDFMDAVLAGGNPQAEVDKLSLKITKSLVGHLANRTAREAHSPYAVQVQRTLLEAAVSEDLNAVLHGVATACAELEKHTGRTFPTIRNTHGQVIYMPTDTPRSPSRSRSG